MLSIPPAHDDPVTGKVTIWSHDLFVQLDDELRAALRRIAGDDIAVLALQDRLGQRQTDAHAAGLGLAALVEPLEQKRQLRFIDAWGRCQ